jgi:hypothetical protein
MIVGGAATKTSVMILPTSQQTIQSIASLAVLVARIVMRIGMIAQYGRHEPAVNCGLRMASSELPARGAAERRYCRSQDSTMREGGGMPRNSVSLSRIGAGLRGTASR